MITWRRIIGLLSAALWVTACAADADNTAPGAEAAAPRPANTGSSYLEERARFQTKLTRRGPAPGSQDQSPPLPGYRTVVYPSGDLQLRAWLSVPESARAKPAPALVFFHGGFELRSFQVEQVSAFREAGFVILFPMLRGEHGNPGVFEALLGEIDDAAAAVRWIAAQPYVDPTRVYTYGHSVGARVSLLVSLRNDVPIRLAGSSAGVGTADDLKGWSKVAPFDVTDERERRMRAPFDFIQTMGHRHVTFVGRQEYSAERIAKLRGLAAGTRLEIRAVDGDHMECMPPALEEFLGLITQEFPATKTAPAAGNSSLNRPLAP